MYDWIYYALLGLLLLWLALGFMRNEPQDDQSEYTGNNPNLPVMKNPPNPPMKNRLKTPPLPNPKPELK